MNTNRDLMDPVGDRPHSGEADLGGWGRDRDASRVARGPGEGSGDIYIYIYMYIYIYIYICIYRNNTYSTRKFNIIDLNKLPI